MQLAVIVAIIIAIAGVAFAMQNSVPVAVKSIVAQLGSAGRDAEPKG